MTAAAGTPYLSLNGKRIQSGQIVIPYYGIWCADVTLALADTIVTTPAGSTLQIGDLSLVGTVFRVGSFSGARSALLLGGAAGWRQTVQGQHYVNAKGVTMSQVLRDAASTVGEQINVVADQVLGTSYARQRAQAERLLRQLAGPTWFVDGKGVTQVGPRTSGAILSPFQVVSWSGSKGRYEIATETVGDWLPGRTFSSSTVTQVQTIGATTITADNDGKLRISILATP